MENLLYYPYINIPREDWTARTLLYYDNVGSIVPQSYFYNPDNYNPFMLDMVKKELVIPINPIEVLSNPWEISRPFLDYVNSSEFKLKQRRNNFIRGKYGKIHKDKFSGNGPKIHVDKFDGEIFYQLEHAGLARRQDYDWFIVEQKTANELMTFLASIIGAKIKYRPTTDIIKKKFSLVPKKDFKTIKAEQNKREKILNELIPFPESIDLDKLRVFKDKHFSLLKAFKNKVETIVLNEQIEIDSPLFNESIRELELRKTELSSKMNENKVGKIFFGTICGIVGASVGLAAADTTGAVIGGLPGFANAIYSALQIERAEDVFDQSGMKYLALVDKRITKPAANTRYS